MQGSGVQKSNEYPTDESQKWDQVRSDETTDKAALNCENDRFCRSANSTGPHLQRRGRWFEPSTANQTKPQVEAPIRLPSQAGRRPALHPNPTSADRSPLHHAPGVVSSPEVKCGSGGTSLRETPSRSCSFAIAAASSCDAGSDRAAADRIVPFKERAISTEREPERESTPEQELLEPRLLRVPKRVELGGVLRYIVELRNESDEEVSLDPCPSFSQSWGLAIFHPGFLNCEDASPAVPPSGTLRFWMEIPIPNDFEGQDFYAGTIYWRLSGVSGGFGSDNAVFSRMVVVSKG